MKKIYLSPAIETVELRFASIICGSDDPDKSIDDGGGNTMFGGGAPQRKPF